MELIAAADTVDFLSRSAPAPWVKRMLLWMIVQNEVVPFFRSGRSIARAMALGAVKDIRGEFPVGEERVRLVREEFPPDLAEKVLSAKDTDYIEELACSWGEDDEPEIVAGGYFLYFDEIDWLSGTLTCEISSSGRYDDDLLRDGTDLLGSHLRNADYLIRLGGLSFGREAIELLQPGVRLQPGEKSEKTSRPTGRPRVWDWEAATMQLLRIAQTPDGLPMGPGAQAAIERAIAEWFMETVGNAPAPSQIRQHASKVMRTLKTPETP